MFMSRPQSITRPVLRPLPPIADHVDRQLVRIDQDLNWLTAMSPLHSDHMWEEFVASGFSGEPKLSYIALPINPKAVRAELDELPLHEVEHPLLHALFAEKQRECVLFTHLLELRDTQGALATSLELFGGTEPRMVRLARKILSETPRETDEEEEVGSDFVVLKANELLRRYQQICPDFKAQVVVVEDLNSQLMVSAERLYVAKRLSVPRSRVLPLLAHEVGTHIVTHFNGLNQSLRQLAVGLACYDELQEGLASLSEYLTGYLPPRRLRTLAARVIAASLTAQRFTVREIFHVLTKEHALPFEDAFDVAVRASRGGGLTKDAVYLRGLYEVIEYLKDGGAIERLYLGKFALSQLSLLRELEAEGWVAPPRLLPFHLYETDAKRRLQTVISSDLLELYQRTPEVA